MDRKTAFLGALALALLLGACTSTSTKQGSPFARVAGNLDLRFYEEPDENRLYLELDKLIRKWRDASLGGDRTVATGIAEQIERYSQANFDTIVLGLASENLRYRRVAAASLGFSGRPDAAGSILEALADPDEGVIENALLSLGRIELLASSASTFLLPLLEHRSAWIRSNTLIVLGGTLSARDSGQFLGLLVRAAEDSDDVVRNNAVGPLVRVGGPGAATALAGLLNDPFPRIRIRAALGLGRLGDRAAVPALVPLLDDVSDGVASAALQSLSSITGLRLGKDRSAWQEWWDRGGRSDSEP